MGAMVA